MDAGALKTHLSSLLSCRGILKKLKSKKRGKNGSTTDLEDAPEPKRPKAKAKGKAKGKAKASSRKRADTSE